MKVLHIFPTNIENQSRLFKEAKFVLSSEIADRISVLGLWHKGQAEVEQIESGLELRRVKTFLRNYLASGRRFRWRFLSKAAALFSYAQFVATALALAYRSKPDFISCHYVTTLPLCYLSSILASSTLVYLPHELETERSGVKEFRRQLDRWIERLFIRKARDVVVVCEPIADWYRRAYSLTNVHVVRNVPEADAIVIQPPPGGSLRDRFDVPESATLFIYQGLFGPGRGTSLLLQLFSELPPSEFHLVLMGYGEGGSQQEVEQAAARMANIHYLPAVPREWITSYTATADVGIFVSERASLSYQYSLPNKFYEYVHAGLPVLVSGNLTYLTRLIRSNEIGWSVSSDRLGDALKQIHAVDVCSFRERVRAFAADAVWEKDATVFSEVYRARPLRAVSHD